jgi:hypothetical protein
VVILAVCVPVVANFRGIADRLAGQRLNRAMHKTYRQAVWYQRGFSAVFAVAGLAAVGFGIVEIAQGNP